MHWLIVKNRKRLANFILFLCCMLSILFGLKLIYQKFYNPFYNVSTEQVHTLISQKKDFTLFIGRHTCPSCENLESHLYNQLKSAYLTLIPKKVAYYNTDKDKTLAAEFKVYEVPKVIVFIDGKATT